MPDGTPAQKEAVEEMRRWLERYRPLTPIPVPIPFGGILQIGATVRQLIDAAGAGQFAVSPDLAQRINQQLNKVQDEIITMIGHVRQAAADPRFGGGYAEQVSQFVQKVAAGEAGSAEEVLTKFRDELGQLKEAVAKSIENYGLHDAGSARNMSSAGGGA